MENALYYGFSTIAQTIAAAIALLGALVLFRLQSLVAAMHAPATFLAHGFHVDGDGRAELASMLLAEDYTAIEMQFREGRYSQAIGRNGEAINARATLGKLLALRATLLRDLRLGLKWTAGVITGSVVTIFLVPTFASCEIAVGVVVTAGVSSLLICLGIYVRIVRAVIAS